jgi:hypothetical protein
MATPGALLTARSNAFELVLPSNQYFRVELHGDADAGVRLKALPAYPMLTGSACIASQTVAKMRTLQVVAAIPPVMASAVSWAE